MERLKLVLLQVIIEVDLKKLKHDADMSLMGETLVRADKVELFRRDLAETCQDVYLHLALLRIGWDALQDLQSHNFLCVFLPALDHLTKGATT